MAQYKRILVVEDDPDINDLMVYHLKKEGYEPLSLKDGGQVIEFLSSRSVDMILLDLMLPGMDGLDICRSLKMEAHTKNIPIIMITAKGEESDVLVGLQLGADDYLPKPFSPKILLARIKAIFRRIYQTQHDDDALTLRHFGSLSIDLIKHKVLLDKEALKLTAIEYELLVFLSANPGRVFSREQILEGVWKEGKYIIDRAVDVHVRALRKKLGKAEDLIETIRGFGYRFKDEGE